MKLEKGMFVRTDKGIISKIKSFYCRNEEADIWRISVEHIDEELSSHLDIKGEPSFDIIDLIEVGDYVNGYKVLDANDIYIELNNAELNYDCIEYEKIYKHNTLADIGIMTILTHEQYEANCYKVGE